MRHAAAGHRRPGAEDDHLRPLNERGRRQALALVDSLSSYDIERVLTSPYVRCRQSVEPLARALDLPVEERAELAEGANREEALRLIRLLGTKTAVLCTHGDVVAELLGEESDKGSTWVLDLGPDGDLVRREYLPAPA